MVRRWPRAQLRPIAQSLPGRRGRFCHLRTARDRAAHISIAQGFSRLGERLCERWQRCGRLGSDAQREATDQREGLSGEVWQHPKEATHQRGGLEGERCRVAQEAAAGAGEALSGSACGGRRAAEAQLFRGAQGGGCRLDSAGKGPVGTALAWAQLL
eukprot:446967-Prymnesium_polylepis.1